METKPSQPDKVDAWMTDFKHPLKDVLEELRKLILKTDKSIGQEIKWNSPTFFYAGPMKPTDPKLYVRYLAVSNVYRQDHIMLVLPHAGSIDDGSGFLEGTYADGRRLLRFYSLADVKAKAKQLQAT